jgi:hypothetical protein
MKKRTTKELRLHLRIGEVDRAMLAALAADDGMPPSAVVRLLVRREFRARGLGATIPAAKPAKPAKKGGKR